MNKTIENIKKLYKEVNLLSDKETDIDRIDQSERVGYNQAITHVIAILENAPAFSEVVSGWVSVKDNVPSDSITVILCHKNKTVTLGHRYNHQWYIENNRVENITHWMPLPEKPNV